MTIKKPTVAGVKQKWQQAKAKALAYSAKRPHKSFRLTSRSRQTIGGQKLPSVWRLISDSWNFILQEKRLFLALGGIYAVATFFIVGGISQVDLIGLKQLTEQTFADQISSLGTATALFAATITGTIASSRSDLQQFLAVFLGFILWLAVVWTARMRIAGKPMKLRDALYNCCAPLIPSFLIFMVIVMQLIPATVSIFLFSVAHTSGLLQNGVEVMVFTFAAGLLCLLSLYWITSSMLAMIVVTLPNMYPWRALATASELVIGQRWSLALRVVALALIIFVGWVVVLFPTLLLEGWLRFEWLPIVPIVAQLLNALSVIFGSVYIYKIYRSLL